MDILIRALQVILALSTLIIVHEFGHFFWAKCFKIRVEKFYLFFDIGGKALVRWKWGETEFGIGWLPFGGYCKISGMIDESMDTEQLENEPQAWEFRTHPAWQRLFVMAGGVVNNFIFAILAYIAILGIWGQSYIPNENNEIYVNELAYEMGFRNGDRILSLDDYKPENFAMLQADMIRQEAHYATVLRGKDTVQLYIDQAMVPRILNSELMFDLAIPFVVDSVMAGSPNEDAGFVRGDRVIAFGGHEIEFMQDSRPVLAEFKESVVDASVVRGKDTLRIPVKVDSTGKIGVFMQTPEIAVKEYDAWSAIPAGIKMTGESISDYLKDLKMLMKPSTGAYKSVGSFIAIGQVFPESWDWHRFLSVLALLSIMLGVINLVPIPGLDGGHILFTLYEMITGRKPGDKFLMTAQLIGMGIIFALMFLAIGNDITRLIR